MHANNLGNMAQPSLPYFHKILKTFKNNIYEEKNGLLRVHRQFRVQWITEDNRDKILWLSRTIYYK